MDSLKVLGRDMFWIQQIYQSYGVLIMQSLTKYLLAKKNNNKEINIFTKSIFYASDTSASYPKHFFDEIKYFVKK